MEKQLAKGAPMSGDDAYRFVAELYDYVPVYRERTDVPFFVEMARESGGPVLEIGCGTGRVLLPTARAGIPVVGLDRSACMLDVCRTRLRQEPADVQGRVRLVESDMRDFSVGQGFALATLPFRPFQHLLTVEDELACLTTVRRHLADDGRLVLDLFNPSLDLLASRPGGEKFGGEAPFDMPDGRRVVRSHRFAAHDRFRQVSDVELIYDVTHPDGRQERFIHAFPFRYLFRFEAEHLLARAGFEVEHLFAGYDKSPYGSTYPGELIFVARKTPKT